MTNAQQGETGLPRTHHQHRQPVDQPVDAPPPTGWSAVGAILLALLAFAAAGALIVAEPGARAAYDAGLAGTPGTFTATSCWDTGSGKGVNHWCTGDFTSTDGRTVLRDRTLRNTPAAKGHPMEVSLQPDGGFAVVRASHVMFDLAACLGLLGMAAGTLVLIGDAPRKRMGQRGLFRRQPWLGLAYTGMLGFPLLMLLAVLTLAAAIVTIMCGS